MSGDGPSLERSDGTTRRSVLRSVGAAMTVPFGTVAAYGSDRSYEDRSGDGIPTELKQSTPFEERLRDVYGDSFDGFDTARKDLLVDARYVGDASIDDRVKADLEEQFRDNGIHLQWLDYPKRYDERRFRETYGDAGNDVRSILWSRRSFYHEEVEPELRDVAFQLVVVPGRRDPPHEGRVYSHTSDHLTDGWHDGWVNGLNVGNRAVVGDREDPAEQARLALHEIAHLVLCHDDDPANRGVMGSQEVVDLTPNEWASLREGLGAIRDTTGYDVVFRRCLWEEQTAELTLCCG